MFILGGHLLQTLARRDHELINYKTMQDEDVVEVAKCDDYLATEYLISKYKNVVKGKARSYYLIGADNEDIVQEGLIGLYKAIRDYDKNKLTSFRVFADICITRQIITAIKTATRQKHIPLNSYISLNKPIYEDESDRTLLDVMPGARHTNPEDLMIGREKLDAIEKRIEELLSDLELKVLMYYIDGMSYQEMSEDLGRSIKSIDNALQRVKRKLDRYLEYKE